MLPNDLGREGRLAYYRGSPPGAALTVVRSAMAKTRDPSEVELTELLMREDCSAGAELRRLSPYAAQRKVRRMMTKAVTADLLEPAALANFLGEWQQMVVSTAPARTRATDSDLASALRQRAWHQRTRTGLSASTRSLALEAHMSRQTVQRGFDRLEKRGLLIRMNPAIRSRGLAARWELRPSSAQLSPSIPRVVQGVEMGSFAHPDSAAESWNHAVWERAGLGRSARETYHALYASSPQSSTELAKQRSVKLRGVQTQLRRLERHQLAARVEDGWLRGPGDLDQLVVELGIAPIRERREAQYREEREHYARAMQENAEWRSA